MNIRSSHKLGNDLIQTGVFAARKNRGRDQVEVAIQNIVDGQPGVGASDVAGQNHFSEFLQWRPSRSIRSSASFGPHVPAA